MPSLSRRLRAGVIAGVFAAGAYAVEQEFDLRAFKYNTDDLLLLGRFVTNDNDLARPIGLVMHLANGAAAGTTYALVGERILPGPPLVRGLTFSLIETVGLFPVAMLQDKHPAIQDGSIDPYWNLPGFTQQVFRHMAFGLVLGPLTARLLRR